MVVGSEDISGSRRPKKTRERPERPRPAPGGRSLAKKRLSPNGWRDLRDLRDYNMIDIETLYRAAPSPKLGWGALWVLLGKCPLRVSQSLQSYSPKGFCGETSKFKVSQSPLGWVSRWPNRVPGLGQIPHPPIPPVLTARARPLPWPGPNNASPAISGRINSLLSRVEPPTPALSKVAGQA
jgi:hypothetical protein